jgi:two-component system, cell cycle response regulator
MSTVQHLIDALVLAGAAACLAAARVRSGRRERRPASALDGLTGMLNEHALAARIRELTEQSALTDKPIALILGDVDGFAAVNHEHGREAGDVALTELASILRRELRAFDMAYRLDDEAFLVLLPGARLEEAREVAERLRVAVEITRAGGQRLTMSFGAASSTAGTFDYDALLAEAQAALAEAKLGGRNRVAAADALPAAA